MSLKKIRKSDMSVEAITDAIHEDVYEKLKDSPETDEEKKIRYVEKRYFKLTDEQADKNTKFRKTDSNRCWAPNWSKQYECPATCVKLVTRIRNNNAFLLAVNRTSKILLVRCGISIVIKRKEMC